MINRGIEEVVVTPKKKKGIIENLLEKSIDFNVPGTKDTEVFGKKGLDLPVLGKDGILFDTNNPIDYGILALAATGIGIPAAIGIKALTSANKISKLEKTVRGGLDKAYIPREGERLSNLGRLGLTRETVNAPETIKDIKELRELIQEKKEGGEIEKFKVGKAVEAAEKVVKGQKKAAKKIEKETKVEEPKTTDVDSVAEGSNPTGGDVKTGNIITRNPGTTAIGGITAYAGYKMVSGEEAEDLKVDDGDGKTLPMASLMGNKDVQDSVADNPRNIGEAMFKNLTEVQGYSVNPNGSLGPLLDKDKNVVRNKPTFGQYLKAFGAGYSERVAKDPEFASKMLAGFASMMSPREGFAPLSPLGVPEFIGGYLSQEQAIQANKGATQKLLEAIQGDPELEKLYLEGQAAIGGTTLKDIEGKPIDTLFSNALQEFIRKNPGFSSSDARVVFVKDDGSFEELTKNKLIGLSDAEISSIAPRVIAVKKQD